MNKNKRSLIIPNVKTIIFPLIAADKGHFDEPNYKNRIHAYFLFLSFLATDAEFLWLSGAAVGGATPKVVSVSVSLGHGVAMVSSKWVNMSPE